MYRIEERLTQIPYTSAAWRLYTGGLTVGYLDLETTGFSHRRDHIILGGIVISSPDGSLTAHQLLCDTIGEEEAMLKEFWDLVRSCSVLVTYNGSSFDLPFLKDHLHRFGIVSADDFPPILSFDLYRIFREYCPMASLLPDWKQTTLENTLGLSDHRKDQIDGGESVQLYERYQALCSDPYAKDTAETTGLRDIILLHNRDDLAQLTRLMKMLDKVDLHRIMSHRGFPVDCGLVTSISLNKKEWRIEAATRGVAEDMDVFAPNLRLTHDAAAHRLTVQISVMYLEGHIICDLEALPGDYTDLERYPACESGYLILHDGTELSYAAVNHCIQLFLKGGLYATDTPAQ